MLRDEGNGAVDRACELGYIPIPPQCIDQLGALGLAVSIEIDVEPHAHRSLRSATLTTSTAPSWIACLWFTTSAYMISR